MAGGTARAQGAIEPPVVLRHMDAVYPPAALAEHKHADVVLAVTVDVDGHVTKIDVLTSRGERLDQAAIVATRQRTSRIRIPFQFAPPAPPPELVQAPTALEPELAEYDYVSDFHSQPQPTTAPARMFAAGPPRSVLVSLALYLGSG